MGKRGFTLMEILVALVIIATVLLYLQAVSNQSMSGAEETIYVRRARLLAREKVEELVLGIETGLAGGWEEAPGFRWEASVTEFPVGESEKVRKLVFTLTYPTVEEQTRSEGDIAFNDQQTDQAGRLVIETFLDPENLDNPENALPGGGR